MAEANNAKHEKVLLLHDNISEDVEFLEFAINEFFAYVFSNDRFWGLILLWHIMYYRLPI